MRIPPGDLLALLRCRLMRKLANYRENAVPNYELPDLFRRESGALVESVVAWEKTRRKEILDLLEREVYGHAPRSWQPPEVRFYERAGSVFSGKGIRKQFDLVFSGNGKEQTARVLMYLPKSEQPVPVFLTYNFKGNQSLTGEPEVRMSKSWGKYRHAHQIRQRYRRMKSRGIDSRRWPLHQILEAGFGVVTLFYGDIATDQNRFDEGIHPLFYAKGQRTPKPNEWRSVAAWAWGLSRVMDYLETDEQVNSDQVVVFGHSRQGKAALWAAATDTRFAACVSNNSGCMGAALSRRKYGETLRTLNCDFPHWFVPGLKKYNGKEELLPFDQHMLLALIAPRPLYIASAADDRWADPKGEFLAARAATGLYGLYGLGGIETEWQPLINEPVGDVLAYHIRSGRHGVHDFDWQCFIAWASRHFSVSEDVRNVK